MQIIMVNPLKPVWLKASVAGSIWASSEIILGSFLHNLKIPFTGMIMSFVAVFLMIAFMQIWKDRGLIWRAGLICAMMKSISPSAVILGPMIGIMSEALLIEMAVYAGGRNIIAYAAGGALAVLSTLAQKIISLLITYGLDLLKIADDLYRFALRQIRLEDLSAGYLIGIITIIYVLTGITGAVAGFLAGRKYILSPRNSEEVKEPVLEPGNAPFTGNTDRNYSLVMLITILLIMISILVFLNLNKLILATAASAMFVSFCIFRYRNSLRRLRKPSFWIFFLVITFSASFLWEGVSKGVFFSENGLITGLKMNLRAVVMVIGFASLSVELKNPLIRSLLYDKGFANMYQSLNLSFSALPYIISTIPSNGRRSVADTLKQSHGLFRQAESIYLLFEKENEKRPELVIITGDVHEGKTTFLQKLISDLEKKGIRAGGFTAPGTFENGLRNSISLAETGTGKVFELCSNNPETGNINHGRFYFSKEAIEKGLEILSPENLAGKQLVVIDEIGPLELKGEGWSPAIEKLCRTPNLPQVWVVRRQAVERVVRRWNARKAYIADIRHDTVEKVSELIAGLVLTKDADRVP